MYTESQSRRLNPLSERMKKLGYRFYNTEGGMGQMAIFTTNYVYLPESEFWVNDFVEMKLTSHHIIKTLRSGRTPYEWAEITAINKQRKAARKARLRKNVDTNEKPANPSIESPGKGDAMNGIKFKTTFEAPLEAQRVMDAALNAAFPKDQSGLVWLNAATDTRLFADQVATVAWRANGAYCGLNIDVDWSHAMPDGCSESVTVGQNDYARLMQEGTHQ